MASEASRPVYTATVRSIVGRYADAIGLSGVTIDTSPRGDGTPHIAIDHAYHYIVSERGSELERRTTEDLDNLLYWIMEGTTFAAACDYELRHRRPTEDFRRLLFAEQEKLLARLSQAWGRRKADEHRRILAAHPFDD